MRAPMVPAPRMATLLMRFIIWPRKKIFATGSQRNIGTSSQISLRQFIHRPAVVASVHHDNAGEASASVRAFRTADNEDNRELVAAGFQQLAARDLVG